VELDTDHDMRIDIPAFVAAQLRLVLNARGLASREWHHDPRTLGQPLTSSAESISVSDASIA
jgi:hypothetical protein